MPTLLEFQQAMSSYLLAASGEPGPPAAAQAAAWCAGSPQGVLPRLAIYRNTCLSTLVNALSLSFPAVRRLVGAEFFAAAAQTFIVEQPPGSAYLNAYGADFAAFLRAFAPAAGLAYLGDVAQLEWAVNRALHASDVPGLDLARLAALDQGAVAQLVFVAHPAVSMLRLQYPADSIWRAVLEHDESGMAAIDPASGPVWLLVERDAGQVVRVHRLYDGPGRLSERLCAGVPLAAALEAAHAAAHAAAAPGQHDGSSDNLNDSLNAALADHFQAGRFIDFHLTGA